MVQQSKQTGLRTAAQPVFSKQAEERIKALERQVKSLKRLVYLDSLTGIGDRHLFTKEFHRSLSAAIRGSSMLSIVFFDVSGLKAVNDTKGLPEGDKLLKKVTRVIKSSCNRESDTPCRVGGDEFAVILPATDNAGAYHFVKSVKDATAKIGISLYSGASSYLPFNYPEGSHIPSKTVGTTLISEATRLLNLEKVQSKYSRILRTDSEVSIANETTRKVQQLLKS
jgi:diguanylate cyclase (GGDEF)-like protein